jgi:chromosome segregation ATPase
MGIDRCELDEKGRTPLQFAMKCKDPIPELMVGSEYLTELEIGSLDWICELSDAIDKELKSPVHEFQWISNADRRLSRFQQLLDQRYRKARQEIDKLREPLNRDIDAESLGVIQSLRQKWRHKDQKCEERIKSLEKEMFTNEGFEALRRWREVEETRKKLMDSILEKMQDAPEELRLKIDEVERVRQKLEELRERHKNRVEHFHRRILAVQSEERGLRDLLDKIRSRLAEERGDKTPLPKKKKVTIVHKKG